MKNQKGFAVIAVLLLALFVSVLFLVSDGLLSVALKNSSLYVCRQELIRSQKLAQASVQKLLDLNSQAIELRIEESNARIALAEAIASLFPPAIAAAEANLYRVLLLRQNLGMQQKSIIAFANTQLWKDQQIVISKLLNHFSTEKIPKSGSAKAYGFQTNWPKLGVEADVPADVAPVYRISESIETTQAQHVSWKYTFELWKRANKQNLNPFSETCQVTSNFENGKFKVQVNPGKFL